jgi:hypothetical protein
MNEKLTKIRKIEQLQATLEEDAIGWHLSNRFLISRTVNVFLVLLCESVVFFGLLISQIKEADMENWDVHASCDGLIIELGSWAFVLLETFISTVLAAFMSIEGVYLKSEFLVVMFSTVMIAGAASINFFGSQIYSDLILVIWCNIIFLCSVVFPLFLSFRTKQGPPPTTLVGYSSLEALLVDPEGYNAFYSFLRNEFSTENLLFYSTVKKFQEVIDQGIHRNLKNLQDQAYRIYKNFLVPGALYEVNVPHSARTAVVQNFCKFRRFSAIEESRRSDHSKHSAPDGTLDRNPDQSDLKATPSFRAHTEQSNDGMGSLDIDKTPRGGPAGERSGTHTPDWELSQLGDGGGEMNRSRAGSTDPQTPTNGRIRSNSSPPTLTLENMELFTASYRQGSFRNAESSRVAKEVNSEEIAAVRSIFDVPQQYVYHLMRTDSFSRFLNSKLYKELLDSKVLHPWTPRRSIRLSISEEIRNFSEHKDDMSLNFLLDKKQHLRLKKSDKKSRNQGSSNKSSSDLHHPPLTQNAHHHDLLSSSSSSSASSSLFHSHPHRRTSLDRLRIEIQPQPHNHTAPLSFSPPHSPSQSGCMMEGSMTPNRLDQLILDSTLPIVQEGGTPRDSKENFQENKNILTTEITTTTRTATTTTTMTHADNKNQSSNHENHDNHDDENKNQNEKHDNKKQDNSTQSSQATISPATIGKPFQLTELMTKKDQYRRLGTIFFSATHDTRRSSM